MSMLSTAAVCFMAAMLTAVQARRPTYCYLDPETGPCEALMPRFFYNSTSDKCENFTYGGCYGNDNNFERKDSCERTCKYPSYGDSCLLPPKKGPCKARKLRYFYNATSGACERFFYGGCKGNANRFRSLSRCHSECPKTDEPKTREGQVQLCSLPEDGGPCLALIPMFHFNKTSEQCEEFIYGGCDGNNNRFVSQNDCNRTCGPSASPTENICTLQPDAGPCDGVEPRFFYNETSARCEEFTYGGCDGNGNNFLTREACNRKCRKDSYYVCDLPEDSGPCYAYIPRYAYNASSEMCEEFIYGGCLGNGNRFKSERSCLNRCNDTSDIDICLLPPETGPCLAYFPRFFFNAKTGQCEKFVYGGCGGNGNRFENRRECYDTCRNTEEVEDICELSPETGPCKANIPMFFYNATTNMCENFIYGGCDGNDNRFENVADCEKKCKIEI